MASSSHHSFSSHSGSPVGQDSYYRDLGSGSSRFQQDTVSTCLPLVPLVVSILQVPVVSQPRGSEYLITSYPLPYQGGEFIKPTLQVGNQSVGSPNNSGWSSGFTSRIQHSSSLKDVPLDQEQGFRMARSPSPIRAPEAQVSDFNSLQQFFSNTMASVDNIHSSLIGGYSSD